MASEEQGADRIRAAAERRTETGVGSGSTAQQALGSAAPEALSASASSDARAVAGRTALQGQAGGGSTAQPRAGGGSTAQPAAGSAAPEALSASASSDAQAVAGRTALRNLPGGRRDARPLMEVDTLPTGRKRRPVEHAEEDSQAHLQRCLGPAAGSTAQDAGFATAGAAGSTAPVQGAGGQPDHRDVRDIAALLMGFGANPSAVDVAEVFCPGRLAEHAHASVRLDARLPSLAADLRTCRPRGVRESAGSS